MLKEIYPVGTKVRIKKDNNEILAMIIGRVDKIDEDSFNDYIGMFYPAGFTGFDKLFNFQEEEIIDVLELGYINEMETKINNELKESLLI